MIEIPDNFKKLENTMKTAVEAKKDTLVEKIVEVQDAQKDLNHEIRKESIEQSKDYNKSMQQVSRVSKILSTAVKSHSGDSLGDIKDLVLDPESGQVAYAVVTFGGVFGVGNKLFAVPFQALRWVRDNEYYILDIDKTILENAPGFDNDHWPNSLSKWDQQREELHQFYRVTS
jgi:sporulation protein YlmC with PRC-barrel domain